MSDRAALDPRQVSRLVAMALAEDLGDAGDVTSRATIPADAIGTARLVAREAGVLCGLDFAQAAFRDQDPECVVTWHARDGAQVAPGQPCLSVRGHLRGLLAAERVALNFVMRLSGIATATRALVDRVAGTGARITDTRKTTPGLRAAEKYAVRVGGGVNHRFGLYDAILIKDNHIAAAGGVVPALAQARAQAGHLVQIEIECDSLEQVTDALNGGAPVILLDNMPPETLAAAVRLINGRAVTEASGGITAESIRAVAETGIDIISVGALTHSAPALDFGLDLESGG